MSARYVWDKYNTKKEYVRSDPSTDSSLHSSGNSATLCNDYTVSQGSFRVVGESRVIREATAAGSSAASMGNTADWKYAIISDIRFSSTDRPVQVLAERTDTSGYWRVEKATLFGYTGVSFCQKTSTGSIKQFLYYSVLSVPVQGDTLQGRVSSASRDAYPDDGASGSNWYVFKGSDFIDPVGISYEPDRLEREKPVTVRVEPSAEPFSWEAASMPEGWSWDRIAYGGGRFVAIAGDSSGKAAYSADGESWTVANLPEERRWGPIAYGDGKFIVLSPESVFAVSLNGAGWTKGTTSIEISGSWNGFAYGGGKFAAISSDGHVMYSADGEIWMESRLPALEDPDNPSNFWSQLAFGNGRFLAKADTGNFAAYSTDGVNWIKTTLPFSSKNTWALLAFESGKFVALSYSKASYSADGVSWSLVDIEDPEKWGYWGIFAAGGGKFAAIGVESSKSIYSTDGLNWNAAQLPALSSNKWRAAAYGDDAFFVTSQGSQAAQSKKPLGGTVFYQYQYSLDGGNIWSSAGAKTTSMEMEIMIPDGAEQFMARVRASDDWGFVSTDYITGNNVMVQTMRLWMGVENTARRGRKLWVGVDGKSRPVVRAWVGDESGKARRWF